MAQRYAFGGFLLEPSQQRLLDSQGAPVALTPRLFSALLLFVERAGELIDKDSMMAALWPGLVVEENNLNQVVAGLRRALGDGAHGSRFIQTVPRRGFRFVAPVMLQKDTLPDAPPQGESPPHRIRVRFAMASLGVAAAGAAGWWAFGRHGAAPPAEQGTTLAVLPFRPLSSTPGEELLGVGMADSLIARLSSVPGLVVRSTGSVVRYAEPQQDPVRVARELDVAWIVDGSLQRQGGQVRATVRLLRASDGVAAWSGSFDQKFVDVFEVQDQIAARLLQALAPALKLVATAPAHMVERGGTRSLEAYELYVAAVLRGQSGRPESIDKALSLLHQALAVDPDYALAWAMLAWTYRRRLWSSDTLPSDVFEPAGVALQRALELVPDLAQGRAGVGFTRYWFEFDWPGAEREFRAALATNPNEVSAHHGLSILLLTQDRMGEGFGHIRQARQLLPMSPLFNTLEASYLLDDGKLEPARQRLARALDIDPNYWLANVCQGLLHFAQKEPAQGIAAFRRAVEHGDGSRPRAMLAVHLVATGEREEAGVILSQMLRQARERYIPPTSLAAVHAALGQTPAALSALERGLEVRDTRMIYLKDDPHWRTLRREPRFMKLMSTLKLDGYGRGLSPV